MKKSWLATFLTLALLGGIFAPGLGQSNLPKTKEEFVKAYVRYLSQEEASRWVKTQGKNFVYIGSKELFPGLGALLKGREVKVFVGEGVREIPWLEKSGGALQPGQLPRTDVRRRRATAGPGRVPSRTGKGETPAPGSRSPQGGGGGSLPNV